MVVLVIQNTMRSEGAIRHAACLALLLRHAASRCGQQRQHITPRETLGGAILKHRHGLPTERLPARIIAPSPGDVGPLRRGQPQEGLRPWRCGRAAPRRAWGAGRKRCTAGLLAEVDRPAHG